MTTIKTDIATQTVGELAVVHPEAKPILERFGIDYCCGGGRRLTDAAAAAGVDLSILTEAINAAAAESAGREPMSEPSCARRSWAEESLTGLVNHIENTHHGFMKEAIPRLSDLFTKVLHAHGDKHGKMLMSLETTFAELRAEIEAHLMKEEQVLFPYIRQMESSVEKTGRVPPMHCGTVQNPIHQMEMEHEIAGDALAHMRSLTNDYTLPGDACTAFQGLFEGLRELESDLHEHIHLENNVLFPRTIAMEESGNVSK